MTELAVRYRDPTREDGRAERFLIATGDGVARRFPFFSKLEIGRDDPERLEEPGLLLVRDPTISRHHCVVTQHTDGRCFVRDVSRNGTRLDGRRLVPNVETEWRAGQVISIGAGYTFVLAGGVRVDSQTSGAGFATVPHADRVIATVLVGDIRDYTGLVRKALSDELQQAVRRLFETLSAAIVEQGGTLKEYQGDAVLAFWEGDASGSQALRACRGALALDALAMRVARDRAVWPLDDFPLRMEWALATGLVLIDSFGGRQPAGLSMMGEPVVRAFRIEKLAGDETGRIVACNATRQLAARDFEFRDLGEVTAKGFEGKDRVFALVGERGAATR